MKNFILIFSFCALVAVAVGAYLLLRTPSIIPQFIDDQGQVVALPTNSKIYLHFWGSWCGPCVQELPELDKYATKHPEIAIYAIHIDHPMKKATKEEIEAIYEHLKVTNLKVYYNPDLSLVKHFNVQAFPSTIEVTPDFQEIKRFSGPQQWQYFD